MTSSAWEKITDGIGTEADPIWWHKANPQAVSLDEGESYYLMTDSLLSDGSPPIYQTRLRPVPPPDTTQENQSA